MSGYQNAGWLSRLWSLARPGDPVAEYVSNVNVVNDRRWASSRERGPYASHAGNVAAAGAGVHNFVEIGGLDRLGPTLNLLHALTFECLTDIANSLVGLMQLDLADGSALTTATRVATTPRFLDADDVVTPQLFLGTIATANIPATALVMPSESTSLVTAATPSVQMRLTKIEPVVGLPFARSWIGPRNLIVFGPANVAFNWAGVWQAIRA